MWLWNVNFDKVCLIDQTLERFVWALFFDEASSWDLVFSLPSPVLVRILLKEYRENPPEPLISDPSCHLFKLHIPVIDIGSPWTPVARNPVKSSSQESPNPWHFLLVIFNLLTLQLCPFVIKSQLSLLSLNLSSVLE